MSASKQWYEAGQVATAPRGRMIEGTNLLALDGIIGVIEVDTRAAGGSGSLAMKGSTKA
jgi:hypothetical protein